ncbi:MAG: SPASM domain-containing protein, partial [Myxococcota bacterium]
AEAKTSDEIAGAECFERKVAFAREVRAQGLPLTLNVVLHRRNLARVRELIALARELDADRLELANAQYQGWGLVNRAALLPTREALEAAAAVVADEQERAARPEILFVFPDYFRERPKPCMGGWARRHLVVTPDGRALPCHGAAELPLEFWNVKEHALAECWNDAPGMNAFRGEGWMQEPCRSCPERSRDFGGCRCQAFALTGDAAATDPTCTLAPEHGRIEAAHATPPADGWRYRAP